MTYKKMMVALAVMALAGCKGGGDAPKGQVVATVGGQEITVSDLREEMALAAGVGGGGQNQAAALEAVIQRKIIAQAATKEDVERLPSTAVIRNKALDGVLVDALLRKYRASVPLPSADEARQYVSEHPSSFAQRRIQIVDQYIVERSTPELLKALDAATTLEQAMAALVKFKVPYHHVVGTIDALTIDGDEAEKIAALPPHGVFVSPEGDGLRVNYIRDTVIEPISNADAQKVALETLRNRRVEALVANKIQSVVEAGQKTVRLNNTYAAAPAGK
jgi:EpsD family peptidyl-prolyl cis-trans isomerase